MTNIAHLLTDKNRSVVERALAYAAEAPHARFTARERRTLRETVAALGDLLNTPVAEEQRLFVLVGHMIPGWMVARYLTLEDAAIYGWDPNNRHAGRRKLVALAVGQHLNDLGGGRWKRVY